MNVGKFTSEPDWETEAGNLVSQLEGQLKEYFAVREAVIKPKDVGKLYESCLMIEIFQKVNEILSSYSEGGGARDVVLILRNNDKTTANDKFYFRGKGGPIYPQNHKFKPEIKGQEGLPPAGHAFVKVGQKEWELHHGLVYAGSASSSKVGERAKHEIDISLIPACSADSLRSRKGGHPKGIPLLSIECKYKPGLKADLDEIRQTLARIYDLTIPDIYDIAVDPDSEHFEILRGALKKDMAESKMFSLCADLSQGTNVDSRVRAYRSSFHSTSRLAEAQIGAKSLAAYYGIKIRSNVGYVRSDNGEPIWSKEAEDFCNEVAEWICQKLLSGDA